MLCCLVCWAAHPTALRAQAEYAGNFASPDQRQIIYANRVQTGLTVDGALNEADWKASPPIDDFFRMEPIQGGRVSFPTEVRILFDEKNLYVGVFCLDSLGPDGVRVQDFRRDFIYGENDIFYFQLDPQNLQRYCVSFQTTPLGTQRDLQVFNDERRDNDWDALWEVKSKILPNGWSAEFVIPFKSLRYELPPNGEPTSWGFTAARLARREYEQSVFPPIPQSFSPYRMTYAAQLRGLELPKPGLNIRVNPYLLYGGSQNSLNGQATTAESTPKLGGDVKWALNSHAVVDLTLNTDFAQADVDRAVNNLSRFNVFFPERRQFFLENSGIFPDGSGISPYFSRTIGLSSSSFNAVATPIDVGLRYNDRNEERAISAMYVHQRAAGEAGGASFSLARYQRNIGKEGNIGALLTHRYDEAGETLAPNHNATFTVDYLFRPSDVWTLSGLLTGSYDESSSRTGHAGNVFAGRNSNSSYLGWLTKWVSADYDPKMGFVFGKDIIQHNPGGYYIWRSKKEGSLVRRADPGLFVNYFQSATDGRFQILELYLFPGYFFFRDNSFLELSFTPTWQNIDFAFAPLGIPIAEGDYAYTRYLINYNSDRSRKISGNLRAEFGEFFDGRLLTFNAGLRAAPSPRLVFTADYELNRARSLGPSATASDVHLYSVGLRLAANSRLQGTAFYQYNTLTSNGRINARISWEYRPLSFLFLVFNDSREDLGLDRFTRQEVIGKLNWMRQF
ncbi:DUF5916 domain-containing protein [Neolewinella lacunae]|uniref:Carbohydrate binding family 9 domain-containing protein n=1 Tax=Neolewinella lacunae TaxID=1517758 RepID=A0A923PLX4_9BACT|nr:DUF5916 domain-containing protein [Neolewinella lacunae]MBC6995136.1 carbohydrate binding family 9 domain-containing protein [Neolewinella lacunae]MDN3634086.1 DUF5916 domain-containing protein [Neolewinella lacunae]